MGVGFESPVDGHYFGSSDIVLKCTGSGDVSLYGDFDGTYSLIETKSASGVVEFNVNVGDGRYVWGCSEGNETVNRTFTVDTTVPIVDVLLPEADKLVNISYVVNESNIDSCSYSIDKGENVSLECYQNLSLEFEPGNYTFDLFVKDKVGLIGMDSINLIVKEKENYTFEDFRAKTILNWKNYTVNLIAQTNHDSVCKYWTVDLGYDDLTLFEFTNGTKHNHTFSYDSSIDSEFFVKCRSNGKEISNSVEVKVDFEPLNVEGGYYRTWDDITGARTLNFDLSKKDLAIQEVEVKLVRPIEIVRLRVDELSEVDVTKPPEKVYKYFKVDWLNLDYIDFDRGRISFIVHKDWLQDNSFDSHDVVLLRFNGEGWEELSTVFKKRYGPNYLFDAEVPKFSYFAVSLQNQLVKEVKEEKIKEKVVAFEEEPFEVAGKEIKPTYFWVIMILVAVLLFGFGGYVYYHRADFGK